MRESAVYYLVKILGVFFRLLPHSWALGLAGVIGYWIYVFMPRARRQVYANLKTAFASEKPSAEIKEIAISTFINTAKNFVELLRLPLMNSNNYKHLIYETGLDHIRDARKLNKGVIIVTIHFGAWEMASIALALYGFPLKAVANVQVRNFKLNQYLNSYRSLKGTVILERGFDTREILRTLSNNEVVSLLSDQAGKNGEMISFLGRNASFASGAVRIALRWGVPICFGVVLREQKGTYRMVSDPPLYLKSTGDKEKDIKVNLEYLVKRMEHYICLYPQEYMWFNKVWKYSNEANVVIIHDGKMGHLRQSQAVASAIVKQYAKRGVNASVKEVLVKFKSDSSAKMFSFFGLFGGSMERLKYYLTPESYSALNAFKADVIVSCGSSVSGINYHVAQDNQAKSVVIQRPGLWSFRKFNLVILPKHDAKENTQKPNVAVTMGAPNIINDNYLEQNSRKILERFSHLKKGFRPKIGLFIGGDSKHIFISERQIRVLVNQLKGVLGDINYDLLVTTSRRTPSRIENILYKELKGSPNCSLLVIASKENIPETVGGILALSDIVIVSGDSISMVSEAATSGKKVIVFLPEKRIQSPYFQIKHQRFIDGLNQSGHVMSISVEDASSTILQLTKGKIQTKRLNDQQIIEDAVEQRII